MQVNVVKYGGFIDLGVDRQHLLHVSEITVSHATLLRMIQAEAELQKPPLTWALDQNWSGARGDHARIGLRTVLTFAVVYRMSF